MGLLREHACPLDRARADQAHLSYGNNPLHDAARDGDLEMLRKILDRVPGTFTDNRFSKWEVRVCACVGGGGLGQCGTISSVSTSLACPA